jgi:hypothetical protein
MRPSLGLLKGSQNPPDLNPKDRKLNNSLHENLEICIRKNSAWVKLLVGKEIQCTSGYPLSLKRFGLDHSGSWDKISFYVSNCKKEFGEYKYVMDYISLLVLKDPTFQKVILLLRHIYRPTEMHL